MEKAKNISLENLSELWDTEEKQDNGIENTFHVVLPVSFMIGINITVLEQRYGENYKDLLETLKQSRPANIVRSLSILRTTLMNHFLEVDQRIRYNLDNIDRIEWFDSQYIRFLQKEGIPVVQPNFLSEKYSVHFTKLIDTYINECKDFFPEWIDFSYIHEFFVVPKYEKAGVLKAEYEKYQANKALYPYQIYIHWKPSENGYILNNDLKFLKTLYEEHGTTFNDAEKARDASHTTKKNIYEFIQASKRVVIVVDCENSDCYKLYGVLKSLDEKQIEKVERIILYDDLHTTPAWDYLEKFLKIPVEHIEVARVVDHKSLVDIKMTAGVCKAYYEDKIDSFLLFSSDSDFWGLISSIPDAEFLVMYEYAKCGENIKITMNAHGIYHAAMDDFYQGNGSELQKKVLQEILEDYKPNLIGTNAWELTKTLYEKARISASENEMRLFYNNYIKSLRLVIDRDGNFTIQ